ncbi:hypothetical protein F5Y17DRAFT_458725 [Xylariaceae sp. FL0594]|nr:hypothetical protein F5Y17DRAFT_458725 [Xylariaceae sp. FL0594]
MADPAMSEPGRNGQQPPFGNLPLELALDIVDTLTDPEDVYNFAVGHRDVLRYWLKLGQDIDQRCPDHQLLQDVEAAAQADPAALANLGPMLFDPERGVIFELFAQNLMNRFFSQDLQLYLMLILYMPDPAHRVWDIDYRRANPALGELAELQPHRPSLQGHPPVCDRLFAKKALSDDWRAAVHSPPALGHRDLLRCWNPHETHAAAIRDRSTYQSLEMLNHVERERLRIAFFQYETLCATNAKITGYWEIDDLVKTKYGDYDGWNNARAARSVLADESACQVERVNSVYRYVRLVYLVLFWNLFEEYNRLLFQLHAEYEVKAQRRKRKLRRVKRHAKRRDGPEMFNDSRRKMKLLRLRHAKHRDRPEIFNDPSGMEEWIDILCSRGLVFLYEITAIATKSQPLTREEIKFGNPSLDPLRLQGYVFWEKDRSVLRGQGSKDYMWEVRNNAYLIMASWGTGRESLRVSDQCFRWPAHLNDPVHLWNWTVFCQGLPLPSREDSRPRLTGPGWRRARKAFAASVPTPAVVDFGVRGETWRIAEEVSRDGEVEYAIEPDIFQ